MAIYGFSNKDDAVNSRDVGRKYKSQPLPQNIRQRRRSSGGSGGSKSDWKQFYIALASVEGVDKISINWGNIELGSEVVTRWPFPVFENGKFTTGNKAYYPEEDALEGSGELYLVVKWLPDFADVNGYKINAEVTIVGVLEDDEEATKPDNDYDTLVFQLGYWETKDDSFRVVPYRTTAITSPMS